jgi:hypothetical protein
MLIWAGKERDGMTNNYLGETRKRCDDYLGGKRKEVG